MLNTLYLSGPHRHMFSFKTQHDCLDWDALVRDIKDCAADCTHCHDEGITTDAIFYEEINAWLVSARRISGCWGNAFLPADIMFSINDAEHFLGTEITQFPPIHPHNILPGECFFPIGIYVDKNALGLYNLSK